ncbi:hypothetical protein [Methylocystis iwaonis]|uniref:hypothetical protein n=1 Tax=Methylocystis iwaonis TaxID=2885079 RepID=UPI002E7C3A08|nr:hypothetical protein [Methylocystis iwaonis]
MLGFEIWKNGEKLATAGVNENGVISLMLTWVGKGAGTPSLLAGGPAIEGLDLRVGGIDSSDPSGEQSVEWIEDTGLHIGDNIQIKLVSTDAVDAPARREPTTGLPAGQLHFLPCANCGAPRIASAQPSE